MRMLPFRTAAERQASLGAVVQHLERDGLIAYPTETVYGFGGQLSVSATASLARLKGRSAASPFLLLIRDAAQAPGVQWNDTARVLADVFWPGPLTIALPTDGDLPAGVVSADGLVALRASPHPGVQAIVQALGGAITSTSANAPGGVAARTAAEVLAALANLDGAQDVVVLDGGELPPSPPSTLVRCDGGRIRVLREGAVPTGELRERLPESGIDVD